MVFQGRVRVSKAGTACTEQQTNCDHVYEEEVKHIGSDSGRDTPGFVSNGPKEYFDHGENIADIEEGNRKRNPYLDALQIVRTLASSDTLPDVPDSGLDYGSVGLARL